VKLNLIGLTGGAKLTVALQSRDGINEPGMGPRLNCSLGLSSGNDVRGCLVDYAEALEF
jgi:hypothetical protein